jgi:hypothetical protein
MIHPSRRHAGGVSHDSMRAEMSMKGRRHRPGEANELTGTARRAEPVQDRFTGTRPLERLQGPGKAAAAHADLAPLASLGHVSFLNECSVQHWLISDGCRQDVDSAPTVDQAPQASLGHGSPDGIVVVQPQTHSDVGLQIVTGTPQRSTDQPGHHECREEAGTPGSHRTHDPGPQRGGTFVPTLTPVSA